MANDDSGNSFVAGFLVGGIVGAIVGILLAPKPGSETRSSLVEQSESLREQADELAARVREAAGPTIEALKDRVGPAIEDIRSRVNPTAEAEPAQMGEAMNPADGEAVTETSDSASKTTDKM